jgi:hypothetical protein
MRKRFSHEDEEDPVKVESRKIGDIGEFFECQWFGQMLLYVVED